MFEQVTGNRLPWMQRDPKTGRVRRFGLCPDCGNAMQLIGITRVEAKTTPHGRHRLRPVPGFAYSLERILNCDRFDPSRRAVLRREQTEITAEAIELRDFLVKHFNIAVGILQEDLGFELSRNLLDTILETWLEDRWWCRRDAHKGNLPWLFARITVAHDLYGQRMRPQARTCRAILSRVPQARLGKYHRLLNAPGQRLELQFTLLAHTMTRRKGQLRESIDFQVMRPGRGLTADVIFKSTIPLRSGTFLARVERSDAPGKYGRDLLDLAQAVQGRYLARHPEARPAQAATHADAAPASGGRHG